jgi:adenosylmethionine-8-amino-7-oxononanoate aminotransferase
MYQGKELQMSKHSDGDHYLRQSLTRDYPLIVRGKGHYLWDDQGTRYFDGASGGVGCVLIGHGVPEVLEAMAKQAASLCHAHISMFNTEPPIRLAERIIRDFAPDGMSHVYFTSTGTEANETAVKMARRYHLERGHATRFKVICRWGGYHGSSLAALSYGGRSVRRPDYHPYYFNSGFIPSPYCYRCPYRLSYPQCDMACAWALEDAIKREGEDTVSAFISEAYSNTSGVLGAPPEYFPIIRQICDKYDVLLIIDEVITGWGRTGSNFAIDHWGVVPDLVCTGKGIGSGYAPLAATIVHENVVRALEPSGRSIAGFTYGGNPLSCAVGDAVLTYITDNDLVARSASIGAELQEHAQRLRELDMVGDVRGKGLLLGVEYVADKETGQPFPRSARICETITDRAFANGLVTCPINGVADGVDGDATVFKPPLTAPRDDVMAMLGILEDTIQQVQEEL